LIGHTAKTYCDESTAVKESVLAEVKACMLSIRLVSLLKKRGSNKKKTTSTKIANEIPVTIEDKNINENSQLLLDVINGTLQSSSLLFELSFLVDLFVLYCVDQSVVSFFFSLIQHDCHLRPLFPPF
jgi:hypothetical protein